MRLDWGSGGKETNARNECSLFPRSQVAAVAGGRGAGGTDPAERLSVV